MPQKNGVKPEFLRDSQGFEKIFYNHNISSEKIFLLQLGLLREYAQRKIWVKNFLQAGGFSTHEDSSYLGECLEEQNNNKIEQMIDQQLSNMSEETKIIVLCASDDVYRSFGGVIVSHLLQENIKNKDRAIHIMLSGNPRRSEFPIQNLFASLYQGCNHVLTLKNILEVLS